MSSDHDEEEMQLHEDEGVPVDHKRKRNNDAATKLEVINWARENSIHSAAKKYKVERIRIKTWMHRQVNTTAGGSKRKRHVEQRRRDVNFSKIFAMDETAIWFDCPENRVFETKGAKDGKLIVNWAGSIWMNDTLTEDYLRKIIGGKLCLDNRLLVWNVSFRHVGSTIFYLLTD